MKISFKKYASEPYLNELTKLWHWYQSSEPYLEVYSSGTSGPAKLIRHPRAAVLASAQMSVQFFSLTANSKIGLSLPLDKIGGLMLAIRAFLAEAQIVPINPQINPLAQLGPEESLDFISLVPNQLMASRKEWNKAKQILVGGGPISAKLEQEVLEAKLDIQFWQSYASTETISHVAIRKLGKDHYQALKSVSFAVNAQNCLVINAPSLGIENLETKDQVELLDEHQFRWKGRQDNVVLSGGLKLYPEEIEQKLNLEIPFFLTGLPDDQLGEMLAIAITNRDYKEGIKNEISLQLSGVERPKAIIILSEFSYTSTDKIMRTASLANQQGIIDLRN